MSLAKNDHSSKVYYMLSELAVNVHIFTVFCLILSFNGSENAALVHLLSKTLAKKHST